MRKQVTFYMDDKDYSLFQKKYPQVASQFLRRCVIRSIKDSNFFQQVFFETSDSLDDCNSYTFVL